MDTYSQNGWTEAQWTQVQEAVRNEAKKVRVAAAFLPLHGPLPEDTQTVPLPAIAPLPGVVPPGTLLEIIDFPTRRLSTLSVNVALTSAQVAQEDLSSALLAFRRAANLIARAEDQLVFMGQPGVAAPLGAGLEPCNLTGGDFFLGLLTTVTAIPGGTGQVVPVGLNPNGLVLVARVTQAIGMLEALGYLGPFALVLNTQLFNVAHDPTPALVLPADRIRPLIDGPLLRSSTMDFPGIPGGVPPSHGIVVSLAGDLLDLVVASEICVRLIQVTAAAGATQHVYRVSQRFTLRVKQPNAIVALAP